jgi:hypothetical protein
VTPLQVARAAYLWQLRLHSMQPASDGRLGGVEVAFQWLLELETGGLNADLLRTRAGYIAELYAAHLGADAEIADLAALHHDLLSGALDQAAGAASSIPLPQSAAPPSRAATGLRLDLP